MEIVKIENTTREKKDGTQAAGSTERKLLWDEENRLEAIDENGFVSNYWYDAAGERTVKTSGESEQMYVNGIFSGGNTSTANFTAYVNPYIVVSKGGHYTKHIYIGSQRIVSKLGDLDSYGADPRRIEYAGNNVDGALVNYKNKYEASQQVIKNRYAIFEVPYLGIDNDDYVNGQGFCCDDTPQGNATKSAMQNDNPELFQYYYHSDHLGSTSLITNLDGEVVQHVEYVPFGEVFIEERNNTWNTPYLFNAKELDEETGLYYYGARYYEPRTSIWLSADPLQEKYPNLSTYAYILQNPVNAIDPDGRDAIYIAFPKYKADGYPFTGHAGVLLIDNKTGLTKYYEYGRYDEAEMGVVRNYSVANVVMKDGMPTAESLNKVLTQISDKSGKGQVLEGAYVVSDNFDTMNDYAKGKLAENNDANRKPYDIISNNCGTFADDVVKQDKNVDAPSIIDPRPVSIISEYQSNFTPISYDPKKGTSIKLTEQTTIFNNQTKTTEIKQNWWQSLWYDTKE